MVRKKIREIKYHKILLETIDTFRRPKWGKFISPNPNFDGVKAYFRSFKNEFTFQFKYDIFLKNQNLHLGQYHTNVQIQFGDLIFNLESIFLGSHSSPKLTGTVDKIHTNGFSENLKYYYQLVIPLEKEMIFHHNIEQTFFSTDIGYNSRSSTIAVIKGDSLQVCCVNRKRKDFFLVIDSPIKQTFNEFAEKANSIKIGLGYLSGYYVGNQGYFFAYTAKKKDAPKYFRCVQFRQSIKSGYCPVCSNSNSYLYLDPLAKTYASLLRTVSIKEFSILCEKLHQSVEFSSMIMLILESSVASLLFMPGGYAIALESMSDLVIGNNKMKLAPIKDKLLSKKIRNGFRDILDNNSVSISPDDLLVLRKRVDQFNQTTNIARLQTPFSLLNIELSEEDLKILDTRNDFLHGRVPDLTCAGINRPIERINKDLYYASIRFYTLLNMLILKWIGYDNRVVNFPKIHEGFTKIDIQEEPFRQV